MQSGTLGVCLSIVAVLTYLWFRFEWQFAVGAVIATMHDLLLTVGFFSITHLEFNTTSIAAILTIVGYSLNEAVVVLDRIREMMRKYKQHAGRRHDRHVDQCRAAAHDHDGDDGVPGARLAHPLRRPGDPVFFDCDDVGNFRRNLFLHLHLFAGADLSRRAQRRPSGRRSGEAAGAESQGERLRRCAVKPGRRALAR